jgi:hypothetical protein
MKSTSRILLWAALAGVVGAVLPLEASAYNFWRQYNGRQDWETAGYYDLSDEAWAVPGAATLKDAFVFDWSIDFPKDAANNFLGPFAVAAVRDTWRAQSAAAINDWASWANIKLGAEKAAGQGHIRFSFKDGGGTDIQPSIGDPVTAAPIRYDYAKADYWDRPFINPMTMNPDPAALPVAAQIRFSALHEFGHALGPDDLHEGAPYSEDFVDHPVAGAAFPDRDNNSRRDNIMQGCTPPGGMGCDYSHKPVIDNDEIAAVTWLWGGPYNQIVTGDLKASWNHATLGGRDTEEHHGDQDNPLGWWDYRGSVVSSIDKMPYIDIAFSGYQNFLASTYPNAPVIYGGNQGGSIERFIINQAGWTGNFELFLRSTFTDEKLIPAWVVSDRMDKFIRDPSNMGLVFGNGNEWAKVFGPIPEPSSAALALISAVALSVCRRRAANH